MAAAFQLKKASNGEYYFNLLAGNGQVILQSEMYKTKQSALEGIDSVKNNAFDDARYERRSSTGGQPYFVLKAGNGQVIGRSQVYAREASMNKGIESVKSNAPTAIVEDLTT